MTVPKNCTCVDLLRLRVHAVGATYSRGGDGVCDHRMLLPAAHL